MPVFIFSFADPDPWVARAKEAGAIVICQVQSLELARQAVEAGADALLAQGNEAGGHTGETNLLPAVGRPCRTLSPSAGAGRRGHHHRPCAGRRAGCGRRGSILGDGQCWQPRRPSKSPSRSRSRSCFPTDRTQHSPGFTTCWAPAPGRTESPDECTGTGWCGSGTAADAEILAHREELASDVAAARANGDTAASAVYMGQGAGHITSIRPASDVLSDICNGAEAILRDLSEKFKGQT